MSLNSMYITATDLNQYFVDKTTGQPLAGGLIYFYEDSARTTPKPVYELTGSPPDYTYTALPNYLTLSSVGTIVDSTGNQVALYYYPYDSEGNIQLYYIVVTDANGNPEFTREAWPNLTAADDPSVTQNNVIVNALSNPQFVDVFFDPTKTLTVSFTGSSTSTYDIGPDWTMVVSYTGAGTVAVNRTSLSGSSNWPTNPPYSMTFTPGGSNITSLMVYQRLYHNPDIWSPLPGDDDGYVGCNVTLEDGSAVTVIYAPSSGTPTTLLTYSNATGDPYEASAVVQLPAASNSDNSDVGYVDIQLMLDIVSATTLTSVQIVGLESIATNVTFNQTPVNRQFDQLFHYYNPQLQYKPIESYLVGWDFPTNPAQFLGPTVAAFATGDNTSNYVWDQTICFQTTNSGVSFARPGSGALQVTAAAIGGFALIQYVDLPTARQILNAPASINLSAVTSRTTGAAGTISLWYTANSSVPNMFDNDSLIIALDANGYPSTVVSGWLEVPRVNQPEATFSVKTNSTTNFNDYGFFGWDLQGAAAVDNATFVAIVVGFAPLAVSDTVSIGSISLVPGYIPTRPAPKTSTEVLLQCQRFYETSYPYGVVPGTINSADAVVSQMLGTPRVSIGGGQYVSSFILQTFYIQYECKKRVVPMVSLYSSNTGTISNVYATIHYIDGATPTPNNVTASSDLALSNWVALYSGNNGASYNANGVVALYVLINSGGAAFNTTPPASWISYHYVADCRLGIV